MLELFKKNHWIYSILLLPYSIVLHTYGVINPSQFNTDKGSLSFQLFFGWLHGNVIVEVLLAALLVFIQAVLINRIIINNRMSNNITLIPGLFYITLCSFNTELLHLSPALIAVSFVLLAIVELNKIYIRKPVPVFLYNYGVWSTLAFVIYPPLVILLVVGLLSMQIMRGLKMIEIQQMLGGVFTILFLFSTLFYFKGQLAYFWSDLFSFNLSFFYNLLIDSWVDQVYYIFLFALLIISLFGLNKVNSNIGIKEKKKWQIIIFLLIGSLLAIVLQQHQMWHHWHLLMVPIAMILGVIVGKMKQNILLEAFLLLLLVAIVFLHFNS